MCLKAQEKKIEKEKDKLNKIALKQSEKEKLNKRVEEINKAREKEIENMKIKKLKETEVYIEKIIEEAQKGDKIQLERRGYCIIDSLAEGDKLIQLNFIPDGKTKSQSIIGGKVDAKALAKGDKDDTEDKKAKKKKEREAKKAKKEEKKKKKEEEKKENKNEKEEDKKEEKKEEKTEDKKE